MEDIHPFFSIWEGQTCLFQSTDTRYGPKQHPVSETKVSWWAENWKGLVMAIASLMTLNFFYYYCFSFLKMFNSLLSKQTQQPVNLFLFSNMSTFMISSLIFGWHWEEFSTRVLLRAFTRFWKFEKGKKNRNKPNLPGIWICQANHALDMVIKHLLKDKGRMWLLPVMEIWRREEGSFVAGKLERLVHFWAGQLKRRVITFVPHISIGFSVKEGSCSCFEH